MSTNYIKSLVRKISQQERNDGMGIFGERPDNYGFPPPLAAAMRSKGIDLELTKDILTRYNAGEFDRFQPVRAMGFPRIDGKRIIDLTAPLTVAVDLPAAEARFRRWGLELDLAAYCRVEGETGLFDQDGLSRLGILLYPYVGYGVLNGGSASSYFDNKKNVALSPELYEICAEKFTFLAELGRNKAKALVPAYINEDGTPGATFIELKMRALLLEILRYQLYTGTKEKKILPLFQMASIYNYLELEKAYDSFGDSPYLRDLMTETGVAINKDVLTGVQPMLAAYTHSSFGRPKEVFSTAYGKPNNPLPMPGGHGQNFQILSHCYRELFARGIRMVYLGNVDNLGFTVNPVAVALLALQGKTGGFEFAFRTVVDTKGGVLVIDQDGRLNCVDLGVAISQEEVLAAEKRGAQILFNCATGLFDLEYLVAHLEEISKNLPVRFSDQDKDAGRYSQAEQVTWEIIGMLDDFYIFGIDKYDRFLAAKIALETLLASGVGLHDPRFPQAVNPAQDLKMTATKLHAGLQRKLMTVYGLKKVAGRWTPKTVPELKMEIAAANR
ncbi:UTP--glucose-1-phosphate uridylyltransferase [Hydrogenispora sp. UU3]|uniref:UTP--glucose-1-phosphate uridylyltransferase n=2 Tax=Capillibacterium thermochitinicola TaxID=2699427 RepID=A0A8J6LSV7_9FIRM|nr:UTP--glucose-1-phosphate uridylyltransferase [Capillibacterium thermochitinicola]